MSAVAAKAMLNSRNVAPIYNRILSKFPDGCSFSFAYGSAVKQQKGVDKKTQMIDLIFAVDNPREWHYKNTRMNPSHYSFLKYLGSDFVSNYQQNYAAQVYFNTMIPLKEEKVVIKYGVITKDNLISDLLDWNFMYISGRLHKPVEVIQYETDPYLHTALQANLTSAVHAALLLLPEKFSEYEFYYTISGLSYTGDFRMKFGENKKKVKNIVDANLKGFRHLYTPTLKNLKNMVNFPDEHTPNSPTCEQELSAEARHFHLTQLAAKPQRLLEHHYFKSGRAKEAEDTMTSLAKDKRCSEILQRALHTIVWNSSVKQSVKNIPTAGLVKTMKYSARKIKKMFS